MLINQEKFTDQFPVQAYEAGKLKINEQWFTQPLVLCFGQKPEHWALQDINQLEQASLQPLLEMKPEVLLIGTGNTLVFPKQKVMQEVLALGVGIEIMDTGAACRTYNLLLAEGRKVIAAVMV